MRPGLQTPHCFMQEQWPDQDLSDWPLPKPQQTSSSNSLQFRSLSSSALDPWWMGTGRTSWLECLEGTWAWVGLQQTWIRVGIPPLTVWSLSQLCHFQERDLEEGWQVAFLGCWALYNTADLCLSDDRKLYLLHLLTFNGILKSVLWCLELKTTLFDSENRTDG